MFIEMVALIVIVGGSLYKMIMDCKAVDAQESTSKSIKPAGHTLAA